MTRTSGWQTKVDTEIAFLNSEDAVSRNQAALALIDLHKADAKVANALIASVTDLRTKDSRGTLLYAIRYLGIRLPSAAATQIILESRSEAIWELLEHMEWGLVQPDDNILPQIQQIEAEMVAARIAVEGLDEIKNKSEYDVADDRYRCLLEAHTLLTKMAMKPIQLAFNTTFRQVPWPIAILNIRVEEIAKRDGFYVFDWEEDGFGPAKGFAVIIPTGLWVLFREQQFSIERGVCSGPTIEVDMFPSPHVDSILKDVLTAFNLTDADVQTKRVRNTDTWT